MLTQKEIKLQEAYIRTQTSASWYKGGGGGPSKHRKDRS